MNKIVENSAIHGSGCWIWQKSLTHNGYGRSCYNGKEIRAHRLSYLLYKGSIPNDKQIDHTCNTRACVNPEHLRLATPVENLFATHSMSTARKERLKTHCPQGHEYTTKNTYLYRTGRACRICNRAKVKRYRLKDAPTAGLPE